MIAIITRRGEPNPTIVGRWLTYLQAHFRRFDAEDIHYNHLCISLSNAEDESYFVYQGKKVFIRDITKVWFWHGLFFFPLPRVDRLQDPNWERAVLTHTRSELQALIKGVSFMLEQKDSLGKYKTYQVNKLEILQRARQNGLDIPETIVSTRKEELYAFMKRHKKVATKGIQEIFDAEIDGESYTNYTELLREEVIERLPDTFFPSLFQQYIDKEFDIRVFFIDGKTFAAAIFSQLDRKTSVDFRKYNYRVPNRIDPFILPDVISEALARLLNLLELRTASIDFVFSKGKYYLLDINPVGQFGFISQGCNYNLYREIAKCLMQ